MRLEAIHMPQFGSHVEKSHDKKDTESKKFKFEKSTEKNCTVDYKVMMFF